MHVKICGITREEDAALAVELGASAIGFVFWPRSPRCVTSQRARAIAVTLPAFVTAVGVFADQPCEYVSEVAEVVGLGAVQLHGDESRAYVEEMRPRVIRGVGLREGTAPEAFDALPRRVTLLLDAFDPDRRGGTGRRANWALAARVAARRPTILAGGLHAENVAEAIATVQPYAVDVSSGVESAPGVKDAARMRAFFRAVHARGESG